MRKKAEIFKVKNGKVGVLASKFHFFKLVHCFSKTLAKNSYDYVKRSYWAQIMIIS